jgi:hypothetical protein
MQVKNLTIFASLVPLAMLAISIATAPIETAFAASFSIGSNSVFIADTGNNSVKLVDVSTGKYGGVFVPSSDTHKTYKILGPRGIIFDGSTLLVANQKVNTNNNGEIEKFDASTGSFQGALVPSSNADAPFAPRGIVLGQNNILYVADLQTSSASTQGLIRTYDATSGKFLKSYDASSLLSPYGDHFNPRGLVFGPGGLLYISVFDIANPLTGYILTLDPSKSPDEQFSILVRSDADNNYESGLHRPEGLVFDTSGKLWVTSFRADTSDTDKILSFDSSGNLRDSSTIVLDVAGETRAFAQAILFGPNGKLFAPIATTGELRSYDTASHSYTVVEPASHPLKAPWYLSFRGTDPSTLAYHTFP